MERTISYVYITETPYDWSSGPTVHYLDEGKDFEPIESLEDARQLARNNRRGVDGHKGYVKTSFGVIYHDLGD